MCKVFHRLLGHRAAMFLDKMSGVRQHHGRRASAHLGGKPAHHRLAQHRVLRAYKHQAAAVPFVLPELRSSTRDRCAWCFRRAWHALGESAGRGAVTGIGERRVVCGAFGVAHLRVATPEQAANIKVRFFGAHLTPGHKTRAEWLLSRGQQRVHGQQADVTLRAVHGQGQPQDAAPVLPHQHAVVQVKALHQLQQYLAVPFKLVKRVFFGLVAFAKADQVGGHNPVARRQKHRQHVAIQIAPGRVAVQAQPGDGSVLWAFVQVVQAQAIERGQVAQIVRLPRVARQIGKARVRGAQRIVAQRVGCQCALALLGTLVLKKSFQQMGAVRCQHAALHLCLVVQTRVAKQIHHRTRSAGFGFRRAKHHPAHAGVEQRAAAHGAGLQRDIQRAVAQAVIAHGAGTCAQRVHFGMGGGVEAGQRRVAAGGDHLARAHQHCAHGHFAGCSSGLCLRQRQLHEGFVLGHRTTKLIAASAGWISAGGQFGINFLICWLRSPLVQRFLQVGLVLLLNLLALLAHGADRGGGLTLRGGHCQARGIQTFAGEQADQSQHHQQGDDS